MQVTPVPTALPIARRDYPDVAFKSRKAADDALVKEIVAVGGGQSDGRPCLVGTTSVAQSESLVAKLAENDIKAELLNASPKNAPRESEIVAQAGRAGVVTVATNMAGRGTDILLGGCPKTMARIKTRSFLVEHGVLASDEATKLPPSPGEDYYPCPLNDDLSFMLEDAAASIKSKLGGKLTAIALDEILTVATDTTEAEDDPEYIEKLRNAVEAVIEAYREITDEEKEAVRKMGGLYVMGTNRHESSRIDQQLRGRAGRQGDPGSSRFFLSFEDDMFVVFGGDKLEKMLNMFRVSEDMPVEAPQVSEALDKVQGAVEEKYREIRGEIFKFDEVLNSQRRAIYARRRASLSASPEEALKMMRKYNEEVVSSIVTAHTGEDGEVDAEKLLEKLDQFFPLASPKIRQLKVAGEDSSTISSLLCETVNAVFDEKSTEIDATAQKAGKEPNSLGRSSSYISLVTMDNAWSAHLQAMENLKESVVLRKFQGRDPLKEYEGEAFKLFEGLEDTMRLNAVYSLWQSLGSTNAAAVAA